MDKVLKNEGKKKNKTKSLYSLKYKKKNFLFFFQVAPYFTYIYIFYIHNIQKMYKKDQDLGCVLRRGSFLFSFRKKKKRFNFTPLSVMLS